MLKHPGKVALTAVSYICGASLRSVGSYTYKPLGARPDPPTDVSTHQSQAEILYRAANGRPGSGGRVCFGKGACDRFWKLKEK